MSARAIASVAALAAALGAWGVARAGSDVGALASRACSPLAVDPPTARLAFGDALELRALGGSGSARMVLEGDAAGTSTDVSVAHVSLRAGSRVGRFDVVARDAPCGAEARSHVEVVPPLDVEPRTLRLHTGASFKLAASGGVGQPRFRLLSAADGAQLSEDGTFVAPARAGRWQIVASDPRGARDVPIVVDVAPRLAPLRPQSALLAVVAGTRAPLVWTGGSNVVDLRVLPEGAARVERDGEGGAWLVPAPVPRDAEVELIDRVTHERATVGVLAAAGLGDPPTPAGTRSHPSLSTSLASGDFNGDGRADLAVGHIDRARGGVDAGGVLVFYGHADGSLGAAPDLVLEGEHPGDHYGLVLLATDLDGDGVDDLVVGAPYDDLGGQDRGVAALHLGGPAGIASKPVRVLTGEAPGAHFGAAFAARDLDGDGAPDLVVSATDALNPFALGCSAGRAYVYRGSRGVAGVVEDIPWQTIDLRDPHSDDPESTLPCVPNYGEAGAALALLDLDGDGALDLAAGEPQVGFPTGERNGAVDIYRGGRDGVFAETPTWAIHLAPPLRESLVGLGGALDVVSLNGHDLLVVREKSWSTTPAHAFFVFDAASVGAPVVTKSGAAPRVRVVTTNAARTSYVDAHANGVGFATAMTDVDGDGRPDYLVVELAQGSTRIDAFHAADLRTDHPLEPFVSGVVRNDANLGASIAVLGLGAEHGATLALTAPSRSTPAGVFGGAVDLLTASSAPLSARLAADRASIVLPNFGADDRVGTAVALTHTGRGGALEALTGAVGARSLDQRSAATGRLERFSLNGASRGDLAGDRESARIGGSIVPLDFDGDGRGDVAAGWHDAAPAPTEAIDDPDGCLAAPGASGGTVIRVFAVDGDRLVERARIVPRRGESLGVPLAVADVNGDHRDDVIAMREGPTPGVTAALGRPFVPGRIVIVCAQASGPGASLVAPTDAAKGVLIGGPVARVGDLDRDGCDEIVIAVSAGRAHGFFIAFGHDASGARCHGHRDPFALGLAGSDIAMRSPRQDNPLGSAFDDVQRNEMGFVLAPGGADVTGDGVPDLVFADAALRDASGGGEAVEIVSGAWIASLCPGHVCAAAPEGPVVRVDGWPLASFMGTRAPDRFVLRAPPQARRFGASLAVADLDGDRVGEIAIGAPDAASFAGAVYVYRALHGDWARSEPWTIAYGDARERSSFGASLAIARDVSGAALLEVGAPDSSRGGAGHALGDVHLFRLDGGAR